MSNRRFVTLMLSVPVVAGILIGGCSAAHAAEAKRSSYRTANPGALVAKLPATIHGSCRITERLVTKADGSQHIARKTVCTGR